jgi:hypothetical protein
MIKAIDRVIVFICLIVFLGSKLFQERAKDTVLGALNAITILF